MSWTIPLAILIVWAVSRRGAARVTERRLATQRRIGWGYGYGAGYTDALRGRRYDLTAPEDGRVRPSSSSE